MARWFITGASRGFGAQLTRAALDAGHQVVATARDAEQVKAAFPDAGDALLAVPLDVTDEVRIHEAVARAVDAFGGIDVLINNAGRGLLGAVEEATPEQIRSIYDVNVFAVIAVAQAVLPLMREAGHGTIVNVSSIGGFRSAAGFGVYSSTKFAVEGITEALRKEVAPFGITAGIVEPGYFRTDFLDGSSLHTSGQIEAYSAGPVGDVRRIAAEISRNQPGDPARGARVIVEAVDSGSFPERLFLGSDTITAVQAKVDAVHAELQRQREIATSTDHDVAVV